MRVPRTMPLLPLALLGVIAGATQALGDPVLVNIFSVDTGTGGGAPYTGFVGFFSSPDVQFGTTTGFNWHPFGQGSFGADITGFLDVSSSSTFSFTLNSDDGSLLFIDGSLVVNNGGPHGPSPVSNSDLLVAGLHSFEVQFFECCGGPSGVDLNLPAGVTFGPTTSAVPEPSLGPLLGIVLAGGACVKRFRQP